MKNVNSIKNNKNLTVINLFGGPGSGKSSTAAGLFHEMKYAGYDVELVTEFAKDMVYQKRHSVFSEQDYIFAKQHHRQRRLVQYGVKYCITDSPLLLSHLYISKDYYPSFLDFTTDAFESFNNVNIFLRRVKKYNPKGRNQNEFEAKEIDKANLELFFKLGYTFYVLDGNKQAPVNIMTYNGVQMVDPHKDSTQKFFKWFDNLSRNSHARR